MPYDDLRKGRWSERGHAYFVTTVLADRQSRRFADFWCARDTIAEMRALHDGGAVSSLAWVVMPDHLHWLFQLVGDRSLSMVMKQFKGRSARRINARLGREGPLWQRAFYDHALRSDEDLRGVARYIIANPLRAGLVERLGAYPHWDAVWVQAPAGG